MDSGPKLERFGHVAATSGIKLAYAHEHGSTCVVSALSTTISAAPALARMIGSAVNSMMVNLVRPSQHTTTDDPITLLLLIGLSTAALGAIIHIVGVVMTFKVWAVSFIVTALRFGFCIVCLIKVLTGIVVSFLAEFLCATAADMPSDIKWAARSVVAQSACASLAACFRVATGMAAASACTSTRA